MKETIPKHHERFANEKNAPKDPESKKLMEKSWSKVVEDANKPTPHAETSTPDNKAIKAMKNLYLEKTKESSVPRSFEAISVLPFSIEEKSSHYAKAVEKSLEPPIDRKVDLPEKRSREERVKFWENAAGGNETDELRPKVMLEPSKNVDHIGNRINYFELTDDETSIRKRIEASNFQKQHELERVSELSHFWRRVQDQDEHSKASPNWRDKYQRDLNDTLLEEKKEYWKKQVENEARGGIASTSVATVEPDTDLMEEKRQKWNKVVDQERYRSPKFSYEPDHTSIKTNVEILCDTIYDRGEQYEDGTACIDYDVLFQAFHLPNIVAVLLKARKYGLLYFDGEIISRSRSDYDDENFVVLQKSIHDIRKAFADMRARHSVLPGGEVNKLDEVREAIVYRDKPRTPLADEVNEVKSKPKKIILRRKTKENGTESHNHGQEKLAGITQQNHTDSKTVTTPILKKRKSFQKKSVSFTTDDK